jgi:hypothetical protein
MHSYIVVNMLRLLLIYGIREFLSLVVGQDVEAYHNFL